MNTERIELALILTELKIPLRLDSFDKRLTVQKKIYLAQLMGVDLGYRFSWYLRGPYSTRLTEDAFALIDDVRSGDKEYEHFTLLDDTVAKIRGTNRLCRLPKGFDGADEDWIELLASLHYLRHIAYRPKGTKREFGETFQELIATKPRFVPMEKQARQAWEVLDEGGLISNKTLA